MSKAKTKSHGGTRKGSGRKPVADSLKKKQRAVYLTDDVMAAYEAIAERKGLNNLSEVLVYISENYTI